MGEAVANYLAAVGIKTKIMDHGARGLPDGVAQQEAQGRLCLHPRAVRQRGVAHGASSCRATGAFARGADPDVDALYKQQARETDRKKREAMLHQIQQLLYERVRFGPIWEYIWPSGDRPAGGGARPAEDRPVPLVGAAART